MKNKIYFFLIFLLLFEIFFSQSSDRIKEVFRFYPYEDNLVNNFEEFCLKMNLKKDCMIEIAKKMDIQKIKNISYEFIKSYNNKEESYDIKQDIFFSSLHLLTYMINNKILQMTTEGIIGILNGAFNIGKKIWNEQNERVILEIENFLNNYKYQKLVDENFQEDIDELIQESISQLIRNQNIDYIEDFFNNQKKIDNNNYLNSIFKRDISSLNLFVLGENKKKFIETILEKKTKKKKSNLRILKNKKSNFKIHNNKDKKGLELSEIKSNDDNYFENLYKEFDNIIHDEKKFIYGFIYLGNADSYKEEEALDSLKKDHYNKIPIKKINYKNGEENLSKKELIKFILEELDENKLQKIYKYYYSLNFYENFKNIIINNNLFINIFSSLLIIDIKDREAAANLIINKLKLNLNILLLSPNLDYEDIKHKIESFYPTFLGELNEDLKNSKLDYTVDENKNIWNPKNWFIDKNPNDMIPIFLYEKISKLIEKVFFKKIKEIIINHHFNIKYPNYLNIINDINNNFNIIDDVNKNFNITDDVTPEKSNIFLWDNEILIALVILVIIIIIVCPIYCCLKNKNEENQNKKNQSDLDEELQDINNENRDENQNNKEGFKEKD